ncbi:MAG: hypothetical protein FJY65_02965 [Calditrichaeota bacterium]|nr:hypothetical protein [Calditrichota bacterium]
MSNRDSAKRIIGSAFALLFLTNICFAQDIRVKPLQKLIDCPTPGGPLAGNYDFSLHIQSNGGLLCGFEVGLIERMTLGISYGGTKIVGFQTPAWNPQPGIRAAFRIFNESRLFPALAVGFASQGFGVWSDSLERYQYKAKGLYVALGKNFDIGSLGEISWILGANRNPIEDGPRKTDAFIAFDYRPISIFALLGEFSGALDDRSDPRALGLKRGYLNIGLRWAMAERLAVDVIFRDILINQREFQRGGTNVGREIRISYVEELFHR